MGAHGSPHPGNRRETGAFAWRVIRSQNHIILLTAITPLSLALRLEVRPVRQGKLLNTHSQYA